MSRGHYGRHSCVYRLGLAIALLMLLGYRSPGVCAASANGPHRPVIIPRLHEAVTIAEPANSATVAGWVTFAATVAPIVSWIDFYVDGNYLTSGPPYSIYWNSSLVTNGAHQLSVAAFSHYGQKLGSALVNVVVENDGGVTPGTIPGLTGSAANIAGADTNSADYGNYTAPGGSGAGYGLIGGPLLNDSQAASLVVKTQLSNIELGPDGSANAAANNYFNAIASMDPNGYLNQVQFFWSAWGAGTWGNVVNRIDGACPLSNPTTAEVIQWATNKWGINPLLGYAEASQEGGWDQVALGDNGTSSGVFQVADRNSRANPYHSFPGLDSGAGARLARENTCFNADMWAATIYASFHTLDGYTLGGDIGAAIETWYSGNANAAGDYTAEVYNILLHRSWIDWQFGGIPVPY